MKPLNIVIITVDCLRADALERLRNAGRERANIVELAEQGCYFDNAITASNTTASSLTSILTSVYPETHNVLVNGMPFKAQIGPVLPEVLRDNGYETLGVVSAEQLSSPFGLNRGFTHYINNSKFDQIYYFLTKLKLGKRSFASLLNIAREKFNILATAWTEADVITKRAKKVLTQYSKKPFFLWVHYFDIHQYSSEKEYNTKITHVDGHIGQLLGHLKKLHKIDDTIVVLVADHGEAFGEHSFSQHGWCLYDEVVKVPLIFYSPRNVPSANIGSQVRTIDIAPTLLKMIGIDVPGQWQGNSLLEHIQGKKKEDLLAKSLGCADFINIQSVRSGAWKLIHSQERGTELYDLVEDSQEQNNLAGKGSDIERELKAHLWQRLVAEKPQDEVDEAVKSRLRSLGYFDESL